MVLWITTSANDIGMVDAENAGIKEWMVLIALGGCKHNDVLVGCQWIDDILTLPNVVGRVLESGKFMKINMITFEMDWITIQLDSIWSFLTRWATLGICSSRVLG